jgi:hypothetical protein
MGLVRSPEIWKVVEDSKIRIERELAFLQESLESGEQIELHIVITKEAVALSQTARVDITPSDIRCRPSS